MYIYWYHYPRWTSNLPWQLSWWHNLLLDKYTCRTYLWKKNSSKITTNFHGNVTYYLGIKVTPIQHKDGHLSIYLNQPAFIENLLIDTKLDGPGENTSQSPYHSGFPIDSIPQEEYSPEVRFKLTKIMQHLVGSLNWLATSTCPDIATITNLLAKYMANPTKSI